MSSQQLKHALVDISKLFEKRYGQRWVKSDGDDREHLEEKLHLWKEELERINVVPDTLKKVAEILVSKNEFSEYPPVLNKFIALYKEYTLMFKNGESGVLYKAIKTLDEKFTFTYGSLWNINDKDKSKRRLDYWLSELKEENIDANTIQKVSKEIRKKPEYLNYPATLGQFILECKFFIMGDSFIDPDIAYRMCYEAVIDNVIIRTTKSKIGAYEFRASTDNRLKSIFTKMYLVEVTNYCGDKEQYLAINDVPENVKSTEKDEPSSYEDSSSFLEQLINNVTTK